MADGNSNDPISAADATIKYSEYVNGVETGITHTKTPQDSELELGDYDIDIWSNSATTITVNKDFCQPLGNGLYRYYFKVPYNGVWNIDTHGVGVVMKGEGGIHNGNSAVDRNFDATYTMYAQIVYYIDYDLDNMEEFPTLTHSLYSKDIDFLHMGSSLSAGYEYRIYERGDQSTFAKIERVMSQLIVSIAKVVNWLISKIVGRVLTLDDIIFNKYGEIRLDFFSTDVYGQSVTAESTLVNDLKGPVTDMYNFFKNIVLVGYLIILIYIGIKIMLSSTTAKKKATYKQTFTYWVSGIVILFFMPYYMKYIIAFDDALVQYIGEDAGLRSIASKEGSENSAQINAEHNKGWIETDYDQVIDLASGKDFMSTIGLLADSFHKMGYSVAYLVLTWQVITMLIYYYKRIFITAILIIIFPLVAFTYVWDKLNDGRSQALSEWIKEFTTTVIVQAFHAIVYVFITNTIYATLVPNGADTHADFILLVIASSFMFVGEEILKKLFGASGQALGSATQSAVMITTITRTTFAMGTKIVKRTVGKDGYVRKAADAYTGLRTYAYLSGKPKRDADGNIIPREDRRTRFQILAENQNRTQETRVSYLPKDGEITDNLREADDMIDIFNNHLDDPNAMARALASYDRLMNARNGLGLNRMTEEEKRLFDEMMQKCSLNPAQLDTLHKAMVEATISAGALGGLMSGSANADAMKRISQNLRLEIEMVFPAFDEDGNPLTGRQNVIADKVMCAALASMRDNGITIMQNGGATPVPDWDTAIKRTKETAEKIQFATFLERDEKEDMQRNREAKASIILSEFKKVTRDTPMTPEQEKKAKRVADKVAALQMMETGKVFNEQMVNAVDFKEDEKELAEIMRKIAGIDADIDTLKLLIAAKISNGEGKRESREKTLQRLGYGDGSAMSSTEYNTAVNNLLQRREDAIYTQFIHDTGTVVKNRREQEEIREVARNLAKLELFDTDVFSSSQLQDAKDVVNASTKSKDRAKAMLKYLDIDFAVEKKSLDGLNHAVSSRLNLKTWADNTVIEMQEEAQQRAKEYKAKTRADSTTKDDKAKTGVDSAAKDDKTKAIVEEHPEEITIYDILEATQHGFEKEAEATGKKVTKVKKVKSVAEMLGKASIVGANETVMERKTEVIRKINQMKIARSREKEEDARKFGEIAFDREGYNEKDRFPEEEKKELTLDGLTLDDFRKTNVKPLGMLNDIIGLTSDLVITPITTLGGFAIGAGTTNDFMPLEEAIIGATGGYNVGTGMADKIDRTARKLTMEDEREKRLAKIRKRANSRIDDAEDERLKARKAFEDAAYEARDGRDNSLEISGANVNMHIEEDGTLSATVNIMAKNADFISISENSGSPSGGWKGYQESMYYQFQNDDPSVPHTLYVYVRDRYGNMKGVKISGIKM